MVKQMEKKMENEMETGILEGIIGVIVGLGWLDSGQIFWAWRRLSSSRCFIPLSSSLQGARKARKLLGFPRNLLDLRGLLSPGGSLDPAVPNSKPLAFEVFRFRA